MFTARRLAIYAEAARLAGADAFFCKSMEPRSLLTELMGLHRSAGMLLGAGVRLGGATGDTAMLRDPHLSPRQEEIMELAAQNFAPKKIAGLLAMNPQTVYTQLHRAEEKLRNAWLDG